MGRGHRHGFGVMELVVAAAVFLVLAGLVGALLVRSERLAVADDARLGRTLRSAATVDALRFELARAGWGIESPAVRVEQNVRSGERGGHVLSIAFVEDRWRGEATTRQLAMTAGRDGRGIWSLYRSADGAPRQPVVAGLQRLIVVRAAAETGWVDVGLATPSLSRVHALELELAFVDGTVTRTIAPLRTPQALAYGAEGG